MNDEPLKNTSKTNWGKVDAMTDEEIDFSDIPPLGDDFFERAELIVPPTTLLLQISPEAMEKIKSLASQRHTSEVAIATEWLEEKAALAA